MNIGVLGGGQLALMLAEAAGSLAHGVVVLDHDRAACAGRAAELRVSEFDDVEAARALAGDVDVVTYEFERVPVATVEAIEGLAPVRPGPEGLRIAQDRVVEKRRLRKSGFPTADFAPIDDASDLEAALESLGRPAVLKTRFGGYDGKGQVVVRDQPAAEALAALGDRPAILEAHVPFTRELSLVCARSLAGEMVFYPVVENEHHEGILRVTRAPAEGVAPNVEHALQQEARRLAEAMGYVGVLAIELFDVDGRLLANEIAPRVHNSGHWTIEGAETSQFENHVRAVTGAALGSTTPRAPSVMVNVLGAFPEGLRTMRESGVFVHDYGKAPRAGRKVGHVTVVEADGAQRAALVAEVEGMLGE